MSRSNFVSVLAWVFIVGAGFATFISLLQVAMFAFLFSGEYFALPARGIPGGDAVPFPVRWFLAHPYLFFLFFWALAVVTLVAAIGLLRRKNWARVLFIALMTLGIVWNLAGLWIQHYFLAAMPNLPPDMPSDFTAGFKTMAAVIGIASAFFAVFMSVLFGWIAVKLMSRATRAEFDEP